LYVFTVPPDGTVTVTVTEGGPVDYSDSLGGPYGDHAGTIAVGQSVEFARPATLRAKADSELELVYPVSEPPDPEPPPED
jgi:hypothetical protein